MRIQTPTLRHRLATCALVLGIVALAAGPAAAQSPQGVPFTNLQNQINQQAQAILQLQQQNAALQALLACISPTSTSTDLYFVGCNVHIVNGRGFTATTNGLGNLIVGYNESPPAPTPTDQARTTSWSVPSTVTARTAASWQETRTTSKRRMRL